MTLSTCPDGNWSAARVIGDFKVTATGPGGSSMNLNVSGASDYTFCDAGYLERRELDSYRWPVRQFQRHRSSGIQRTPGWGRPTGEFRRTTTPAT